MVGGILMSTIAMSGLYERTFRSRSSAVPLWPTISKPPLEQARNALTEEHGVVGEDDPDGRRLVVPLSWGLGVDRGSVADPATR